MPPNRRTTDQATCDDAAVPRTTTPSIPAGTLGSTPQPTITVDDELLLRPWQPTDVEAVLEAFQTPDIVRWHARHITDRNEAIEWIDRTHERWRAETKADWAITEAATDTVLGRSGLRLEPTDGIAEVAYWMLPIGRGRRAAVRATITITQWAHDTGFERVELEHSVDNEPSGAVARSSGFVLEGIKRASAPHADGRHDMKLYAHLTGDPLPRIA